MTRWRIPGSPWWWSDALASTPPGLAAQRSFARQLTLAAEDAAARRRGPTDVGRQRQTPDGAGCWGDPCWHRRPGPNSGPEVDADPLGLCPGCREEIVP